ncbi:MAG: DNA-directed DNA polymerase [Candidatus Pacearchaeota archaeon]
MVEITFIPLDYEPFEYQGKNWIKIYGRTKDKKVCVLDNIDTYFYAILKQEADYKKIDRIKEEIEKISVKNGRVLRVSLEEKSFLGRKVKAFKIYTNNHKSINDIAEKIKFKEIDKIRETDINLISRYIIDKEVTPLNWHKITGEILNESQEFNGLDKILKVDLVIKSQKVEPLKSESNSVPEFIPKTLAFDIETSEFEVGKGEILMISVYGKNIKKVITHKKTDFSKNYIERVKNEKELLEKFEDIINKEDPDIITGYFSDGFDLPYIKARAEKYRLKLQLGLDDSNIKVTGGTNPRIKITGRVHIDLLKFIQTAYSQYLQSETLGLGDVANELLGEGKKEHVFKDHEKLDKEEWGNFFEYSLHDSYLTYELFMKIWPDMIEFTKIMGEPLWNVSRDGMSANVDNYIIHNLYKYNEIIEKKPEHDEISKRRSLEKYEGAFVLEPVPNLYEDIVMFDFTSMYASVIVTYNLSKSTFREKKEKNSFEVVLDKKNKVYFTKEKGFFPDMLEQIINLRKEYKAAYKKNPSPILKARSNAFKLLANAAYGYQGFFGARYYQREAAAATAALAKNAIKETIKKIESNNFKIIYSDTDSIVLLRGKKSKSEVLKMLNEINKNLPGIMELELEDFYKRGIWVTTRGGEIGAKKKYALINEKGKLKIRGFETVRRDWCGLARDLQNKVLEKILKEGNEKSALSHTKEIINRIKERKVERKSLIIRTQLKKPLSEYKANTPHVTIARKMLALGRPVNAGMLIEYYISESNDKKALTRDRAVLPDEDRDYDINYYLNKQVLPAVENIFQVFGINTEEIIKGTKQKTLF